MEAGNQRPPVLLGRVPGGGGYANHSALKEYNDTLGSTKIKTLFPNPSTPPPLVLTGLWSLMGRGSRWVGGRGCTSYAGLLSRRGYSALKVLPTPLRAKPLCRTIVP